jgi:SOS response regulatory protein OraA/RecX
VEISAKIEARIERITPVRGGSALSVEICVESGGESESRSVVISAEDYGEMRCLQPYAKAAGRELTLEQVDALDEAAGKFAAIERGLYLLSFGDATEAGLARKLREKGFDAEASASAASALAARGYIDESAQVERLLRAELRKGRGPARILAAAREKRFGDEAITHLRDAMVEVDFAAVCAEVIEKKYGSLPDEPKARQKAIAALMRLGFSMGEIRSARG